MNNNLIYQIALTLVPNIGAVQARTLVDHFGNAEAVFKASASLLDKVEGIGPIKSASIKKFNDFKTAEKEIAFIDKYNITPLFITEDAYPKRLLNCYDPPTLLYYRGNVNLNHSKMIAVVGTRNKTEYGRQLTETLIHELAEQEVIVISGLALGIDAIAHKSAIKNNLPTIGVLAHGLDKMYPPENHLLAKEMLLHNGGLLTEFRSDTKPGKHHFPSRNRLVAGMSDAVIVVETGIKGGSIITAELANGYNKDVFAFPGRTTDAKSAGCNYLIKNNKAILLTGADQLIETMGWCGTTAKKHSSQKELFISLSEEEKKIVALLAEHEAIHIDELNFQSGLSNSAVASIILQLELQNIIAVLPGKRYALI